MRQQEQPGEKGFSSNEVPPILHPQDRVVVLIDPDVALFACLTDLSRLTELNRITASVMLSNPSHIGVASGNSK